MAGRSFFLLIFAAFFALGTFFNAEAKKVKVSHKGKTAKIKNMQWKQTDINDKGIKIKINILDSVAADLKDFIEEGECLITSEEYKEICKELEEVNFAGYDKEVNSSIESFIIVNPTRQDILGFNLRIVYLDMQGRMLHSRDVSRECEIPAGESRRFDISVWDKQHVYYYHLGNQPKKIATPFQVKFQPLDFWIRVDE